MNNRNPLTREQALGRALDDAGIGNIENRCLLNRYIDGLYEIVVHSPYMKYEFYVDAESGQVLGLNTEPLPYPELLSPCGQEEKEPPAAA